MWRQSQAYQDFFALWKDVMPITNLIEAKKEYTGLK